MLSKALKLDKPGSKGENTTNEPIEESRPHDKKYVDVVKQGRVEAQDEKNPWVSRKARKNSKSACLFRPAEQLPSRLRMLYVRHVRTHDELSQIIDSLLEGRDAILDLERTLQSLHAMIEVAVDAMLFNGCLVAGLVSSSSRIVGRLLLDGHAEWLHGVLMLVRERVLGLRMLSMLSVGWCDRSDVGRCRRHRRQW